MNLAGPQGRVLQELRRTGGSTASELARELGGGAVAMRVHLRHLQAAGLVTHVEERRDVGRPVRRFQLTASADEAFPKQYQLFAVALADAVVERLGPRALKSVLDAWSEKLEPYLRSVLADGPSEAIELLARHQSSFGFMASAHKKNGVERLLERNCPISAIAARYPVICEKEAELFARVTGRKVTVRCCQAQGDAVCEFAFESRRKRN